MPKNLALQILPLRGSEQKIINSTWSFLKQTWTRWGDDQAPRMAASLAYFTAFSIAPLLVLLIALAGLVFGREAAEGRILEQLAGLVGPESAKAIQSMIVASWKPAKGVIATLIGLVTLIFGATGVLVELKAALNHIWRTKETGGLPHLIVARTKLVGMILGIGFLMMVSLALSAVLAAVGSLIGHVLPVPEFVLHALDMVLSMGVLTILFALMFKVLPDTPISWIDVRVGALVTAVLFTIGKFVLGLYLGKGAVGSTYGAAGSVMIVLLWVYYSALLVYFGAEFTYVFSERYGSRGQDRLGHSPPEISGKS